MFDRTVGSMVAGAAACTAAVVAVVAAGFALYAFLEPMAGAAGAAAAVALVASASAGAYALYVGVRAHARARASEAAQTELLAQLQGGVGDIAQRHPAIMIAVAVVGGVLATRHPRLAQDLLAVAAQFGSRSTS